MRLIIGIDTKCRYRKGILVYTRHYGNGKKDYANNT